MGLFEYLSLKIRTADAPQPVAGSADVAELAANVYFKCAAIDTAVSYYTNSIVKCEIKTFEAGNEAKGQLYYLWNIRPNPNQNASQLKEQAVYALMTENEALVVPIGDSLYVADSFSIDERQLRDNVFRGVSVEGKNVDMEFPSSGAVYLTLGNGRAKALVDGMYEQYSGLMAAAIDGFKQGCGTKWKLNLESPPSGDREFAKRDDKERKDPRGPLKTFMSNANSIYIQSKGQDLEKIDVSGCSSDDVIKIRKDAFELVASIYRIPPPMLFGNMTNMKDNVDTFLTFGIDPLAQQWSDELTAKHYSAYEWANGSSVVVDTSRISHIDIFEKAPAISQLIGSGFSLDEVRGQVNWPLIGTEQSQEHMITRNYGAIDEVLRQIAQGGGEK